LLVGTSAHWADVSAIAWGPPAYRTTFRALWDEGGLYVRFDACDDHPWHTMTQRDEAIWEEEVVEIFLDPTGTGIDYAEVEISPANVVCDLRIARPRPDLRNDRAWPWEGLECSRAGGLSGNCGSPGSDEPPAEDARTGIHDCPV
jgi:hypothetical protein